MKRGARWDIHIYDPRTDTTRTHRRVEIEGTSPSMADTRVARLEASRRFHKNEEYILAMPSRTKHRRRK